MSRCALVTGASRGIGRAIALTLSRDGFDVAVHYHTDQTAAEETLRLVQTTGAQARLLRFDVGDRAECQRILELDMETHGPYYGVVCNAGVHADAPFPALSGEAWRKVMHSLAAIVWMNEPPHADARAMPIAIGLAAAAGALLQLPRLRDLPAALVVASLGAIASAFFVHTHNYPGRMSIHLVPFAVSLAVVAMVRLGSSVSRTAAVGTAQRVAS